MRPSGVCKTQSLPVELGGSAVNAATHLSNRGCARRAASLARSIVALVMLQRSFVLRPGRETSVVAEPLSQCKRRSVRGQRVPKPFALLMPR